MWEGKNEGQNGASRTTNWKDIPDQLSRTVASCHAAAAAAAAVIEACVLQSTRMSQFIPALHVGVRRVRKNMGVV